MRYQNLIRPMQKIGSQTSVDRIAVLGTFQPASFISQTRRSRKSVIWEGKRTRLIHFTGITRDINTAISFLSKTVTAFSILQKATSDVKGVYLSQRNASNICT